MTFTLPGGMTQLSGNPILVHVTDISDIPAGAENYLLLCKFTNLDSRLEDDYLINFLKPPFENREAWFDTTPNQDTYNLKIEIGFSYNDSLNNMLSIESWEDVSQTIQVIGVAASGIDALPGGNVQLSGNPIEVILKATLGMMTGKTNYKLALKITCQDLMGSPFVELIAPDANLISRFDISGLVNQPVDFNFEYPATGVVRANPVMSRTVTLDSGEVFLNAEGDREEIWNGHLSGIEMRVLQGKIRPYELALLNDSGQSFNSQYIQGGKFLTNLPNNQTVAPNQIIKLCYLSRWPDIHNSKWNFSINTDLKVAHMPKSGEVVFYPISGLLEFSVNSSFIGFNVGNGEKIVSYTFWLSDSTGDISERRTFRIDNNYYGNAFTFIYINPLSGIDCIWLTGEYSIGLKTQSELAYRPVPVLSGSKVASQITVSARSQQTWELNTGSKAEMLALRDFLTSKECWMINPENETKLIPVTIEPGDNLLFDSMSDIQNLTIKILEAHQ